MPIHHDPSMVLHKRGGGNTVYELIFADDIDMNERYDMYQNREASWLIAKSVSAGGILTVTYAKGATGYADAWTNRSTQSYDVYSTLFAD